MSNGRSRSSPPTSDTSTSTTRTGTSRPSPSSSSWPANASCSSARRSCHDRRQPTGPGAGLLHRPPAPAAKSQPPHRRRKPRYLPSAAALRSRTARKDPDRARDRRPRGSLHRPLPRSPRSRARQHRTHTERSPGGDPLVLPLRGPERARPWTPLPARSGDAEQTSRAPDDRVSRSGRDRRLGRRARHVDLDGTPGPYAGLRVSELIGLRNQDVVLGTGANVRCEGKGRKQRCTPLRKDAVVLVDAWQREQRGLPEDPLFPSLRGGPLSRDAVERLVAKHTASAQPCCPSLRRKKVTPHVLRHTAAMELLQHGVDRTVIALWLGHESVETTQMYLHADLRLKEQALSRTTPLGIKPGRYQPGDGLLAFLEAL